MGGVQKRPFVEHLLALGGAGFWDVSFVLGLPAARAPDLPAVISSNDELRVFAARAIGFFARWLILFAWLNSVVAPTTPPSVVSVIPVGSIPCRLSLGGYVRQVLGLGRVPGFLDSLR